MLSVLLRRHLVVCHQMPPQHGEMLAAIETDDSRRLGVSSGASRHIDSTTA